jgi:hypothetical protein
MQVFIVMAKTDYSGNEHSCWYNERVFSTKEAAIKYIQHKKSTGSRDVEFEISTEEVYA